MLIDLGKWIGGPDEGDGLIGKLLGIFAIGGAATGAAAGEGVFDGVGGAEAYATRSGAAEAASGFGRAAGASEGWFGRMFGEMTFWDWYLLDDILDRKFNFSAFAKDAWKSLSDEAKQVATAHGLLRQQLKLQGCEDLAKDYAALGIHLPDEALLKATKRELSKKLHVDTNPDRVALMQEINNAIDLLGNPQKAAHYERAKASNAKALEEFIAGFGSSEHHWWKEFQQAHQEKMINEGRLLGEGEHNAGTAKKWFSELSGNQKTGLVFGAVVAVGAGVFIGANMVEKRREKKHPEQHTQMAEMPFSVLHEKPADALYHTMQGGRTRA